jgi:hypothetical protein
MYNLVKTIEYKRFLWWSESISPRRHLSKVSFIITDNDTSVPWKRSEFLNYLKLLLSRCDHGNVSAADVSSIYWFFTSLCWVSISFSG